MKEELDNLYAGLMSSNLMLYGSTDNALECSFYHKGKVSRIVMIKDKLLAAALSANGIQGILEGEAYQEFRSNFSGFALHLKAKQLYRELQFSLTLLTANKEQVVAA